MKQRSSHRLPGYNYASPGWYFITICTAEKKLIFGNIKDEIMQMNDAGLITSKYLMEIPHHFLHAKLDAYVIMPNHVHLIINILDGKYAGNDIVKIDAGANPRNFGAPLHISNKKLNGTSKTIGSMVRGFKETVTKWFRANTNVYIVWQRNYYDRIMRCKNELDNTRFYIRNNPHNWKDDIFYKKASIYQ